MARRIVFLLTFLGPLAACGGDDGPTGPDRGELEIVAVSGDGQFGAPATQLADPLEVRVQQRSDGEPVEGIPVLWSTVAGQGASFTRTTTVTDSSGSASTRLTLGPGTGVYRVEARFDGLTGSPAAFEAQAADPPVIDSLPDTPVDAGSVIVLYGSGFSPTAGTNVVLFSGIRGEVTAASEAQLSVRVPACLPSRTVDVTAGFGAVRSTPAPLDVLAISQSLQLQVGQDRVLADPDALECAKLPQGGRYLAVVHSAATLDAAPFRYRMTGLRGGSAVPVSGLASAEGPTGLAAASLPGAGLPQLRWEERVRELEGGLAPPTAAELRTARALRAAAAVPQVGDRRDFQVLNVDNEFEQVTAEVVFVGQEAVIYEDLDAPDGGLGQADFQRFSTDFDDFIHPEVTAVYGNVSDLDGNDRVVILFTPVVNSLTEAGADGFVGGFFFGLDLLPERTGSNGGEIFYTLVADPNGDFGNVREAETIRNVVPGILAHEFQHMVNFNQRALVRGGSFRDALWLSEAVAVMAEDIVGEAFAQAGDSSRFVLYQAGNWVRGQRFLQAPNASSLIVTQGQGTLEERGAGWLFLRYLRGQRGDNSLLTELVQTTRTGVTNVTAVTGDPWEGSVSDWAAAIYLDDQLPAAPPRLQFTDLRLRDTLDRLQGGYPLVPPTVGGSDFAMTGAVEAASAAYFLLGAASGGLGQDLAVALGGAGGGPSPANAALQLTLVRLQ